MIILIYIALLALFLTDCSCLDPSPSMIISLQLQVFIFRLATSLLDILTMGRKRFPLDPSPLALTGAPVLNEDRKRSAGGAPPEVLRRRRSAGGGERAACLPDGQVKGQCAK
jgi:hypothetical protein